MLPAKCRPRSKAFGTERWKFFHSPHRLQGCQLFSPVMLPLFQSLPAVLRASKATHLTAAGGFSQLALEKPLKELN